jgi:hypothetical protein
MNMDCYKAKEKLEMFADGQLSREEAQAVEAHLATCADCAMQVESMKALGNLARKMADDEPQLPRLLDERTWQAISGEAATGASIFDFLFTPKGLSWSLAFYCLGLLIAVAGYIFMPSRAPQVGPGFRDAGIENLFSLRMTTQDAPLRADSDTIDTKGF